MFSTGDIDTLRHLSLGIFKTVVKSRLQQLDTQIAQASTCRRAFVKRVSTVRPRIGEPDWGQVVRESRQSYIHKKYKDLFEHEIMDND